MADLGNITGQAFSLQGQVIPFPLYYTHDITKALSHSGILGGNVSESGTPLENVSISVHWRDTGACIGRSSTDRNGDWALAGFDPAQTEKYAVWVRDPAGGTAYNDIFFALVTAI